MFSKGWEWILTKSLGKTDDKGKHCKVCSLFLWVLSTFFILFFWYAWIKGILDPSVDICLLLVVQRGKEFDTACLLLRMNVMHGNRRWPLRRLEKTWIWMNNTEVVSYPWLWKMTSVYIISLTKSLQRQRYFFYYIIQNRSDLNHLVDLFQSTFSHTFISNINNWNEKRKILAMDLPPFIYFCKFHIWK